jgi:putative ABC transport system permease protein
MTTTLERPLARPLGRGNGGAPARRAVVRWSWRLFRREWRQQLLVLALITVAVAATVVGAAVASDTPPPAGAGFGTAHYMATLPGASPHLQADIVRLHQRVGRVDVIANQTLTIPGTISTYDLRSQDPRGPYGGPLLTLVSGRYPAGAHQVAMTAGLASTLGLHVGDVWHQDGTARRVVGIVENPQSLLDEFALVPPGQVTSPTQVTVLFDASPQVARSLGPGITSRSSASASTNNALNPHTIVLALATIGMLLIALVAVGGFTVLAQRRLRSIGMLGALGASDGNVRLVVRTNGVVVGVVGAVIGLVAGLAAWLAYRPHLAASSHHLIGMWAVPWGVVVPAMVIAVVATYLAAARPARMVARMPIVTALSGRPAPPKAVHRTAVPGLIVGVVAFFLMGASGSSNSAGALILGLVALIAAIILLAPFCLEVLARLGRRTPIGIRLALRDLARYRARSGSALAAITLGVLIAVIICVVAAGRYGQILDYAGPNLASNELIVWTPNNGNPGASVPSTGASMSQMANTAHEIAAGLGARHVVPLVGTNAIIDDTGPGRQWNGALYVATPALLHAFGIAPSSIDPSADILTARPGLDGVSGLQLINEGNPKGGPGPPSQGATCPGTDCIINPRIQEVSALPAGVSAPNTVITEHAVRQLGLQPTDATVGWLIQTPNSLSAAQISHARVTAAAGGLPIESKNDEPTSAEILNWATVFGIALALGILAMTVGLIRSETASDLRTLAATGAGSSTRRTLTAATAGGLALLGAVLGTAAGYVASAAWFSGSQLNGGLSALSNAPVAQLLIILIGMPLVAAVAGWLLAGREPSMMMRQPLE